MARDRKPSIAMRLKSLDEAIDLARGRASDEVVEAADSIVDRAGHRLSIAGEHTVVALAGATGSGKSSTFNAISGTQLARTGVTRPTTSEAMSVSWGTEQPVELLDWLDVQRRHLVASGESAFHDLVLLDLPDHDSTEVGHRLTVDRLVELVDMLVWVVDPQKYADGALHDGYLKPLADHAEVMVVVLNQVDRLDATQRADALADLRRLLDAEGLTRTKVMALSALTGEGVAELRALLEEVAKAKAMKTQRFTADVLRHAGLLAAELGTNPVPRLGGDVIDRLNETMAEAAAVPVVTDGVLKAWRHRGTIATGWPMVSWLKRLKPDPLRKLRVGLSPRELSPTDVSRTSLPKATSVQKARLDAALRGLLDAATDGVPRGWADQIRRVGRGNEKLLADRLDQAVAATDLRMDRGHGWWVLVTILQWILFLALIVGAVWLALPLVFALLQMPIDLPVIAWQGWPVQTVLVAGGIAGGVVLALLSRVFVEAGAQVKARQARKELIDAISEVTAVEVVPPIQAELDRLTAAREAAKRAG
ncbi:GTPase [Propioniciclava sinopodophylli]|uniref:GTPase n=1 Tax=Propioniciclava sinopodophylli TaxID=1837344 RepID=UPI00249169A6|nr:GTPase [Propioniciclava sinopodophylli]